MAWNPPIEATSALDLRNNVAIATPLTPTGSGLFVTDLAISTPGYTQLATDPNEILNTTRKNTIRTLLGLPNAITANRFSDIVYELMTVHSDISSGVICPPLMPTHRGRLDFTFAGVSRSTWLSEALPEWPVIQKSIHAMYRFYRDGQAIGIFPTDFHRKILSVWMQNYKIPDFTKFIPSDLPTTETPLPHSTTHTENFNQTDSTTVGPNLSWTEGFGPADWSTISNQLDCGVDGTFADNYIRAEADVSSADHYSEIIIASRNLAGGICNRFSSSASTFYVAWSNNDGNVYFSKVVTGTRTNLTSVAQAYSAPDTIRVSSSGSAHSVIYNGSTIINAHSDSSISTGTRGGVWAQNTGGGSMLFDDFVVSDLVTPRQFILTRPA